MTIRYNRFLHLCLTLLVLATTLLAFNLPAGQGQSIEDTATVTPHPTTTPTPPYDGDWILIGRGVLFLFFALMMIVMLGVGIVLGITLVVVSLVLAGVLMLLIMVGVVSTSSLVGFLSRRRGPAVTALFTQVGAVAGTPIGVIGFWLFRQLANLSQISQTWIVIGGGIGGLLSGAIVGWLFSLVCRHIYRWGIQRFRT